MGELIRWALVQIMACRLFGTKPLSKPILGYCQLDPWEHQITKLFIPGNVSENIICEMAAILSRGRWVNVTSLLWLHCVSGVCSTLLHESSLNNCVLRWSHWTLYGRQACFKCHPRWHALLHNHGPVTRGLTMRFQTWLTIDCGCVIQTQIWRLLFNSELWAGCNVLRVHIIGVNSIIFQRHW